MSAMKADNIWYHKNFDMGTELDISGEFIYNGIHTLNQVKGTSEEAMLFTALYNTAVGIERIQKIILTLAEDITFENYETFEKELITHSHTGLHAKIKKAIKVDFDTRENELLQLLQKFYTTGRYNRFNLNSSYESESYAVSKYILKHIDANKVDRHFLSNDAILFNDAVKNLFGKVIGSISKKYYAIVSDLSTKNNTYTYELRSDSKAQKVFLNNYQKNSLYSQKIDERIALVEFLVFLVNNSEFNPVMRYIKSIQPLELEVAFIQEYIDELCKGIISQQLIDEVEHFYEENGYSKNRIESVEAISNTCVHFDTGIIFECKSSLKEFTEKTISCTEFAEIFQELSNYIDFEEFEDLLELKELCDNYVLNPKEYEESIQQCAINLLAYLDEIYNY